MRVPTGASLRNPFGSARERLEFFMHFASIRHARGDAARAHPAVLSSAGLSARGSGVRPLDSQAMTFVFAGHELDPRRQELRRDGEVVHVEPQVFDLLAFLIRNRDRIVSKDEILDAVWDGRIVSEAALSSRINAARKAIGDSGNDQIFIRTFHKRGFRFVGEASELKAPEAELAPVPEPPGAA